MILKEAQDEYERKIEQAIKNDEPAPPPLKCVLRLERYQDLPIDQPVDQSAAQALCEGCPVKAACLGYGTADKWAIDVWGGKDFGREPRAIRQKRARNKNKED